MKRTSFEILLNVTVGFAEDDGFIFPMGKSPFGEFIGDICSIFLVFLKQIQVLIWDNVGKSNGIMWANPMIVGYNGIQWGPFLIN